MGRMPDRFGIPILIQIVSSLAPPMVKISKLSGLFYASYMKNKNIPPALLQSNTQNATISLPRNKIGLF